MITHINDLWSHVSQIISIYIIINDKLVLYALFSRVAKIIYIYNIVIKS